LIKKSILRAQKEIGVKIGGLKRGSHIPINSLEESGEEVKSFWQEVDPSKQVYVDGTPSLPPSLPP